MAKDLGYADGWSPFRGSRFTSGFLSPDFTTAGFSIFPTEQDVSLAQAEAEGDGSADGGDGIIDDFSPNITGILEGATEAFTRRGAGRLLEGLGLGSEQEADVPTRTAPQERTEAILLPSPRQFGGAFAWAGIAGILLFSIVYFVTAAFDQ